MSEINSAMATLKSPPVFTHTLDKPNAMNNNTHSKNGRAVAKAVFRKNKMISLMVGVGIKIYQKRYKSENYEKSFSLKPGESIDDLMEEVEIKSNLPHPWKFDQVRVTERQIQKNNHDIKSAFADTAREIDESAFVYQEWKGNAVIASKLIAHQSKNPSTKAGLMIRETMDSDSKFILINNSAHCGLNIQWRNTTGGNSFKKEFGLMQIPVGIRLRKNRDQFKVYYSKDMDKWLEVGKVEMEFGNHYLIGLEVAYSRDDVLSFSIFNDVELSK